MGNITLSSFLMDDALSLPRLKTPDYPSALRSAHERFLELAGTVADDNVEADLWKKTVADARRLANDVMNILTASLGPNPDAAGALLRTAMEAAMPHIETLNTGSTEARSVQTFYRARVGNWADMQSPEHLFHIPFEKRHTVACQRYSYPGVPCLYLGASVYCCWKELGEPDLHRLVISAFRAREGSTLRFLDIGWQPQLVGRAFEAAPKKSLNWALANIAVWPLAAACSFQKHCPPDSPFVEEYIIPQLLMSFVINSNPSQRIDGIRYPSPNTFDNSIDMSGMCLAIPARTRPRTGHCHELWSRWEVQAPVSWQLAIACSDEPALRIERPSHIDVGGVAIQYRQTQFAVVEQFLDINNIPAHMRVKI